LNCSDEVIGVLLDVPSFGKSWEREERCERTKDLGEETCETMETKVIVFRMMLFLLLRTICTWL